MHNKNVNVEYIEMNAFLTIFRLMPFMIVAYFVISGIFDANFKAFMVFMGILFSTLITTGISRMDSVKNMIFKSNNPPNAPTNEEVVEQIKTFSIFNISSEPISYLPLSVNIYSFLLVYYTFIMFSYDFNKDMTKNTAIRKSVGYKNWLLITVLILILICEVVYFTKVSKNILMFVIPAIIGVLTGVTWPLLIGKANWSIPKADSNATCGLSNAKYSCKLSTSGTLIK
jgi:hypothetical protein